MHLAPFSLPGPKANTLGVGVAAASIDPLGSKSRDGDMKTFTRSMCPLAMATDFAGTVEAVGSKGFDLLPGDAVHGTVPMKYSGAFAPTGTSTRDLLSRTPDKLSSADAASLPVAVVTAWLWRRWSRADALKKKRLSPFFTDDKSQKS